MTLCHAAASKPRTCCGTTYTMITIMPIIMRILGIVLYGVDLGTDIYTADQHFSGGHYWWGGMTLVFILMPMLITSMWSISQVDKWKGYRHAPLWALYLSSLPDYVPVRLVLLLGAPFVALYLLVCDVIITIRVPHEADDEDARVALQYGSRDTTLIKLCEALSESLPQAALQLYIVFQILGNNGAIATFQWFSIAASLTTLNFAAITSVSTLNPHPAFIIADAGILSGITWSMCGLTTLCSRLLVACVWAAILSPLWWVPFGTYLFTAALIWVIVLIWAIARQCCCAAVGRQSLAGAPHGCNTTEDQVYVLITWVLTATFNGFKWSGLVISTLSLGLSVVGCLVAPVKAPIAALSIILSSISWVTNVLVATLPCFADARKHWLRVVEDSDNNTYGDFSGSINRSVLY